MGRLTWKELEKFISQLTEEGKNGEVTLLDNNHEAIFLADIAGIVTETMYAHYEGLYTQDDINDLVDDELEDFMSDVYAIASKGSPILIVN